MQRMRKSMLVEFRSSLMVFSTTVLLMSLGCASAGGKDPSSSGPVRPGNLDYRAELPQGFLKVYSVGDEFNDGPYYAHSSYAIDSAHGTLFKTVENNISRTDELIPWGGCPSNRGLHDCRPVGESWRSPRALCYQSWPTDDCRSGPRRTGEIYTAPTTECSHGEFKRFVTFQSYGNLHEHRSEE
jgi:hypothetical protein